MIRTMTHFNLKMKRRFPFVEPQFKYSPPKGPSQYLDPEYFSPTSLEISTADSEHPTERLYSIWRDIPGGHKWRHYFQTYESVMSKFEGRPLRMLEIGVYNGGSARMWQRFLHPGSVVVGLDIDPACKAIEDPGKNLFIRIGDQSDPAVLGGLVEEFGPFDFILDDGSHLCSHMIASFCHLFLDGLKSPGVYLAEDTHSNFWDKQRDQGYSFVDLSKDLVDLMHAHYFRNQRELLFRKDHPERLRTLSVPRIAAEIEEIQFRDSLVIIHKTKKGSPPFTEHL